MDKQKIISEVREYVRKHRTDIVEDLKTLVRIPSISIPEDSDTPYGPECARAIHTALEMTKSRGFESINHKNCYGTAFYSGEHHNHGLIGIFSHLDVVAPGSGWSYDPFEPVEKDDFLIGRGAGDNKSGAIIGIYTLQLIKELGIPIKSNVMVYFGSNEENGMSDIETYTKEQILPDYSMVPDLFFPVCYGEKGGLKVWMEPKEGLKQIRNLEAGKAENMIPAEARAEISGTELLLQELTEHAEENPDISVDVRDDRILVTAKGTGGHSSMPKDTVNAVKVLAAFLENIEGIAASDRKILSQIRKFSEGYDGKNLGIEHSDEPSGALTVSAVKLKMEDSHPQLLLNIRYPVTDYRERVEMDLLKVLTEEKWAVISIHDNAPLYVERDSDLVKTLMKVYREVTGLDKESYVIDGGTYARKLKNAVGFGGGNGVRAPFLPKGHGGVHQADEARSIQGILDAIVVYVMAVIELDELIQNQKTAEDE